MVELTFIRHADAGDPEVWQGDDDVRPLSPKGERQADRLGRFLAGMGFAPDAIVTSPKLRALQTAQIVAERIGKPFSIDTRLAGPLSADTLETLLRDEGDPERPVVVALPGCRVAAVGVADEGELDHLRRGYSGRAGGGYGLRSSTSPVTR